MLMLIMLLSSVNSAAQNEGRWYTVEMVIFKRLDKQYLREQWPTDVNLQYPSALTQIQSTTENYQAIPSDEFQLGNYAYALKKNNNYRVLYHQGWKQQMFAKKDSPAILISGGKSIRDFKELEGSIKIHIGRFLHLETDLWLSEQPSIPQVGLEDSQLTTNNQNQQIAQWPVRPNPSRNATSSEENRVTWTLSEDNRKTDVPVYVLRQSRKMRSEELHYIDHPLLGIMVLITPIDEIQ